LDLQHHASPSIVGRQYGIEFERGFGRFASQTPCPKMIIARRIVNFDNLDNSEALIAIG
jgi:hypothetical protein